MRLRSFTAATMADAMRRVRMELGEDAIIVSSHDFDGGKGVSVTAAIEHRDSETVLAGDAARQGSAELERAICEALIYHGTPQRISV